MRRSARLVNKAEEAKAIAEQQAHALSLQAQESTPGRINLHDPSKAAVNRSVGNGSSTGGATTIKTKRPAKRSKKPYGDETEAGSVVSDEPMGQQASTSTDASYDNASRPVDAAAQPNISKVSGSTKRPRRPKRAAAKKLVVESSSGFSGVDSEQTSELSDFSLTSATESSEDEPIINLTRNRRTRGRATRRPARAIESTSKVTSKQMRAYYRDHPTQDPSVWSLHPEIGTIWHSLDAIPLIETAEADQPTDLKLNLLPFQKEGLNWMQKQELGEFKGGVLADEMGMGKTIQMIALLLSEPRGKPNLIVAPTVALMQWLSEIQTHTSSLSVLMFHGQDRTKSLAELMSYDVVLTTYNIIESGFRKQNYGFQRKHEKVKEDSLLHKARWFRIVLDEGHYIKDRACNTARAVFALTAERKWALSGTPLQNRVGELYSLIRFLKADPFSYYFCKLCPCKSLTWQFQGYRACEGCGHSPMQHFCWWNADILKPIQNFGNVGDGGEAFQKLGKLLDHIMLRRTKVQKADDLGLPPRVITVRRDVFNEEEEDMYASLYSDTRRKFTSYVDEGTVLNHYANIFELITKMRLAVNHPDLVLKRLPTANGKVIDPAPGAGLVHSRLVCAICQDEAEDPITSRCKHVFCREDARQFLDTSLEACPRCPACFVPLTIDLSQPTVQIEDDGKEMVKAAASAEGEIQAGGDAFRGSIVNRINLETWRSSTKIEALVEELDKLRSQDHTIKSIVFSQFVNFLDLIHWRLSRAGFACCRLDGRMSPAQRDAIIKTFMQNHEFTVFLISLKAGGIALNLTEASRVFICDPWWNPAVEDQAMDRIHRLGQRRPIQITRLVVENSIESRIIQLQAKKHALFESTIGKDTSALARLTEEDLKFLFVL
ncbi:DNA repair protein rad16 [Massospora cicadina]|nr:DNA repair protein rad16 [Massospora cicadina]